MAKDARELRDEAAAATASGKHKKALAAYLELERLEPRDAQWAKRAGETYRRLGNNKHAIEAFERSVDRYAQNGFLVQAIAVCKIILQIDPQHAGTLGRLARMNEQVGQGPTRAQGFADNNPALQQDPRVAALRRGTTGLHPTLAGGTAQVPTLPPLQPIRERNKPTTPPQVPPAIAMPRTKSKPINLPPGAPLEAVTLAEQVEAAYETSAPGVHVIPIDDEYIELADEAAGDEQGDEGPSSVPQIEIELPDPVEVEPEVHELEELELADLEEIPLPEPRVISQVAQRALAATPLFAGLPKEALEALVEHLTLVTLEEGATLFHEGDVGDALYVIVEGEVSVQAEGPPRVEMARLGAGSFLGEVALMTDQPRSATVSAVTVAELLRIDRHTLSRVLADHGDVLRAVLRFVRDRLVDRWMRTSPLFRPFTEAQRGELAARFKFVEIDAHTKLLAAGQRPDGLYIVLAGNYSVERGGATVAHLGPGDLIGETALLSGAAFKSDVVALGKSLALCLPAPEFREMIMTHPHVLEYVGEQAEHSRRLEIL
ncbi:MAG TPA: cyclic nucleotide-binding domain-containing protein [Kofleriaceae bacterium]|nr:cyclic nucleotide-binding domain-containing protein [Kofleriaceae bacterium]